MKKHHTLFFSDLPIGAKFVVKNHSTLMMKIRFKTKELHGTYALDLTTGDVVNSVGGEAPVVRKETE